MALTCLYYIYWHWNSHGMVTYLTRLRLVRILTCWRSLLVLYFYIIYQFCSIVWVLILKLSWVGHLPTYIPYTAIEIPMEWSHTWPGLGWSGFELVEDPWLYCIVISYINCVAFCGSWLGSYHEYCTYLAISHTDIKIPMEWSHNWSDLGWSRFGLFEDPWLYCIFISYINCLVVLGLACETITSMALA
jgi:hypothetical protein